jgi:hypothetical protein
MAAIVASDIVWRYSVTTGSAGNTTAGTANGSLGKYISTTLHLHLQQQRRERLPERRHVPVC